MTTSWFLILSSWCHDTRSCNVYRRMARVQTNQMKATPPLFYVPVIYGYNSHLIGCRPRHSAVNAYLKLTMCAWKAVHARDRCFNIIILGKILNDLSAQ